MASTEGLPDKSEGSAVSPTLLSATPVSAAAAATIAATTIPTTTTTLMPEYMDDRDGSQLSAATTPTAASLSPVPSQLLGPPTPLSETSSPLLLSSSYLPPSTTSLPSQLEKQQQAQYLRAPPPPRAPSPAPSSIQSIGNRSIASGASTAARPQSVRHIGAALWNDASARRMRLNVLNELSTGWVHLSTSSRLLIIYYTVATMIEIIVTTTILVLERAHIRTCIYLVIFLIMYLIRAVTINIILLYKFLWTRPDNLPANFSGAVGAHYRTLINWGSLVLLLLSIAILTTQSECSKVSPPLFFLVLTFSLLGYICAAALLLIWIGILFCLHGFVALLELFHVGPTALRWQGAETDLIAKVPVVRFRKANSNNSNNHTSFQGPQVPPATFTVTITSPDSENSSRKTSMERGRVSPTHLDTIQESKHELGSDGMEAAPSATAVTAAEHQPQLSEKSGEVAIEIPSAPTADEASHAENPSSSPTSTTVAQLPESQQQQQQQDHPEQQRPPVVTPQQPMATMTIENQGIFVDGHLVHEGGEEAISSRCSICLCEYEDGEELRHMPCNHFFHRECLDEWLKLKRTCPLCKYDIQDLNRFSKRLSWKRHHRSRSSAAASTSSSRNGRSSLSLWRRSQS
ncbi:hypothetical protein BGW41_005177 [Actinomortierella wolfii]|nr:hypothetical protein BGW41_005177 [Actinomortierella wolfii]